MSFHQVQVLGQAGIAQRALCTQCCCLVLHSTISCQGRLQGQERRWASLQQCCCHHSHQDSPLLPFFTHFFQSNLQSPFSVAPLGMLLLHLVDLFLLLRITLCYGLFVLSCFGIYIYFLFLQKFNSVLNQSRNDLLCGFSLDLEAYWQQWGRTVASQKIITIGITYFLSF